MAEKTSALRAKLQRLEASFRAKQKEHLQQNLISELQEKGTPAWERLSTENQYKKSVLLALLSTRNTTTGPPDQLKEEAWKETSFADKVRTDPDIVLARLTSPLLKDDFTKHYLRNDPRPNISYPTFTLPPGFQIDKDLVIAAVGMYSDGKFLQKHFKNNWFSLLLSLRSIPRNPQTGRFAGAHARQSRRLSRLLSIRSAQISSSCRKRVPS